MSKYTRAAQGRYSDMMASIYFQKYKELFGDANVAKSVTKSILSASTTDENVDAVIKLYGVIFKGKGFTEEESIKYLAENKRILELPYEKVFTILALVDTAGLSEKAIFEKPSFVVRGREFKRFYNAVRICRRDDEVPTLERIVELENDEDREIEFKCEKSRLNMYKGVYKAKLLKQLNEQKEKEGQSLKRTEE